MGAATSIVSDIENSDALKFSKIDARNIIMQYVPVFREELFDRHAESDGTMSKDDLLRLVDAEVKYARNMCGEWSRE